MKLFIIGNGFDLDHKLKTMYFSFKKYLMVNYDIYKYTFCPQFSKIEPELDEAASIIYNILDSATTKENWADLEKDLGKLNYSELIVPLDMDFPDDDIHDTIFNNQCALSYYGDCLEYFNYFFREWITKCNNKKVKLKRKYKQIFSNDSIYLTFNYTNLLEDKYNIPCDKILHIHGSVSKDIIFGHHDEKPRFMGYSSIGCSDLIDVIHSSFYKNTKKIIDKNELFFKRINEVDEIYFFGWSISDVDMDYLEEIINRLNNKQVKIHFMKYDKNNKKELEEKIKKLKGMNFLVCKYI